MLRYIVLLLMLSTLNMARGQTTFNLRYWLDNDGKSGTTYTITTSSSEPSLDIDISDLSAGLHALHIQADYPRGEYSVVHTKFFAKMANKTAAKGQYWFDNNAKSKTDVAGVCTFDIDASALSPGLHALHYQTLSNEGVPSAVHTQFFAKLTDNTDTKGQYWFDNDATTKKNVEGTGSISIDASDLPAGLHALHFHTLSSDGVP